MVYFNGENINKKVFFKHSHVQDVCHVWGKGAALMLIVAAAPSEIMAH